MKYSWIGLQVLFVYEITQAVPTHPRIVNGVNASIGQYPYAVSVRYNNCHECGGSIIGDRWVLTAAHCAFPDFVNISTVLFGTTRIYNCQNVKNNTIKVKKAYKHENYQGYGGYFNDIAVLELEESFPFSSEVAAVQLPYQSQTTPYFQDSILVGWGYQQANGQVMPLLQVVDITVLPDFVCEEFFTSNFSTVSHICGGGNGQGQCTGDSGGPLTVDGVQYGIVSWSDKPCASTPGVLTRVASFRQWITNITGI